MTVSEAKQLKSGQVIYEKGAKNADGTPRRWRVNGQVKRWKREPDRVEIPLKHGLYSHGHLDNGLLDRFTIDENDA